MLYGIDENGKKVRALNTGDRSKCPITGNILIAKCGAIKINHWAYKSIDDKPINYKGETEWHLDWNSYFNIDITEIVHTDKNGVKHIADIDTGDTVVEFQHSPLSSFELLQRELYYTEIGRNFIWVLDGSTFTKSSVTETKLYNFEIPYCNRELREFILEHYKGNHHISYKIIDKNTKFYSIALNQRLYKEISSKFKEHQRILNIKEVGVHKEVNMLSAKRIYTRSNSLIYIDMSHIVPNTLYCVKDGTYINKTKFVSEVKNNKLSIPFKFKASFSITNSDEDDESEDEESSEAETTLVYKLNGRLKNNTPFRFV